MKRREVLYFVIKVIISFSLIIMLFSNISFKDFVDSMTSVNISTFIVSVVVYIISVLGGAVKWKMLLSEIGLKKLIVTCFKAQFYSTVLPGQLFGEASKVSSLYSTKTSNLKILTSVVMDKITSMLALMIIGILSLFLMTVNIPFSLKLSMVALLIVFVSLFALFRIKVVDLYVTKLFKKLGQAKRNIIRKVTSKLQELYVVWKQYSSDVKVVCRNIICGVFVQFLGVFQIWYITRQIDFGISVFDVMWIFSILSVLLLLPISFAGLGVRDVSLVGLLGLFGVAKESALTVSAIMLCSQIVAAIVGAIIVFVEQIYNIRSKKRDEQ